MLFTLGRRCIWGRWWVGAEPGLPQVDLRRTFPALESNHMVVGETLLLVLQLVCGLQAGLA